MMVALPTSKAVLGSFLMLCFLRNTCCNECSPPSVYDVSFEFQDNCSLVVNWTEPMGCSGQVVRYYVQFAQGCLSSWTNFTVSGNQNSLKIQELGFFTACLLGDCYVRVVAGFDRADAEPVISHCVAMGDFFHDPSFRKRYFGRHVCIPIFTMCPENTAPSFFINEAQVSYIEVITDTDTYNLTQNNMLCISDIVSDQVIHETCHIHSTCLSLCSEDDGELTLVSRAEIQPEPGGKNESSVPEESQCCKLFKHLVKHNMHIIMFMFTCLFFIMSTNVAPSLLMFCPSNSDNATTTRAQDICLCFPLHQLQNHSNSKNVTVSIELKQRSSAFSVEFSVNGSVDQRLTLNSSLPSQCFQAQFTLLEDQAADECEPKAVPFDICLNYSTTSTAENSCVYIPTPCTKIILYRNNTDVCDPSATTTLSVTVFPESSDSFHLIIIIIVLTVVLVIGLILSVTIILAIIIYCRQKNVKAEKQHKENEETCEL